MNKQKYLDLQENLMTSVLNIEKLPKELKETFVEYITFRHELGRESDRGCSLLAASYLEHLLLLLLKKVLIGDKKHVDSLFEFNGPLGTFSSRIMISYSLGLLSKEVMRDLNIIRKVRNEFGHTPSIIDFNNQKIKSLCSTLKFNVYENKPTRAKFLNAVSGIAGVIDAKIWSSEKFKEEPELDLEKRKHDYKKIIESVFDYLKDDVE